ncbi:MAG TPA: MFS transporter [Thermoanaerobaculia bacterium]|jgi:MFS family permease|nr:MFS transporter [Thermoanaerobaculia bacterium]
MTRGRAQTAWTRAATFLALEPNVVAVSTAMFLLALGENLWQKFLPKYLQALGAPIRAVGLFGSIEDFLDGVYQYPGGWLGDRLGRRVSLIGFVIIATVGYAIYGFAPSWPWIIAGLFFVSAWSSMGSPTLFAVIGDALPKERRAMGFTVQSILKRVPIAVAPIIGGLVIAREGLVPGIRLLLMVTLALGVMTLVVLLRVRIDRIEGAATNIRGVWRSFPSSLRWLLLSDVFIRTCEGLVDVFLVIFATTIVGISTPRYGVLVAVQMITAIAVYIPAGRIADRIGRKPFVIATFVAFSLFPLAVVLARSFAGLVAAFIVGGLRELGEPSRKALIVDFAQAAIRARTIGLYYFIRSLAIAPAAFVGGLLWERRPSLPFLAALTIGLIGTAIFTLTVREEDAG